MPRQVIVVTGASSGIGEATARYFGARGWRVVLAARRKERLEALAESIHQAGGEALPVPTDVTRWEDVQHLAETTWQVFGRVDVLFNNAGLGRLNWVDALDPTEMAFQVQVNLIGAMWTVRAFLPGMLRQGFGHIVNMSSVAGFVAIPTYSVYAATKFGLRGFSDALRREVAGYGIRVSCLYPGGVKTEFGKHAAGPLQASGRTTPSWLALKPEDVARAVWDIVHKPKRSRVLPCWYRAVLWLTAVLPAIPDAYFARLTRQLRKDIPHESSAFCS